MLFALVCSSSTRIVFRVDDNTSLGGREARDDIAPSLVVVYAERHNETLAGVGFKAQGTRRATPAHGESVLTVGLGLSTTACILPNSLLDGVEESVGVGLVDTNSDRVRYSSGM